MFPYQTLINTLEPLVMGRLTATMITSWWIGDSCQLYLLSNLQGQLTVVLITVWRLQNLGTDCQ